MPVTQEEFQYIMTQVDDLIKQRLAALTNSVRQCQQQQKSLSARLQQQQNNSEVTEFEVDGPV
jgi:hypothetical protein